MCNVNLGPATIGDPIAWAFLYYIFYFNINILISFGIMNCLCTRMNARLTAASYCCVCKWIIYDLIDWAVFALKEAV